MFKSSSLIDDLINRELDSKFSFKFKDKHLFSTLAINSLTLEAELKGHEGCVNCLEWNSTGLLLASGSDDQKIMIWDPFENKQLTAIETSHRGNIFSVKFLPCNESLVASCAADRDIYVYDVNKNLKLNEIHAHQGRVKRLETTKEEPFLFWSCGEDGLVLQHDIRSSSTSNNSISNILINYSKSSDAKDNLGLEAKCLSINPVKSELMAVGANDPFARVYDRRMLSLTPISNRNTSSTANSSTSASSSSKWLFEYQLNDTRTNIPPLTFYAPGHLPSRVDEYRKRMKNLSVTFLTFSPNGQELLVNLGGEQLYLFDLSSQYDSNHNTNNFKYKHDSFRKMLNGVGNDLKIENSTNTSERANENTKKKKVKLPQKAEILKQKANSSFEEQNYLEAIEFYNQAIQIAPDSPILYGNRAAALMKRNWDGDTYMAMLDCYMALSLDSMHLKSHFRLAKCLNDLKWHNDADDCLTIFCQRFPDYSKTSACENLLKEIQICLNNLKKIQEKAKYVKKNKKLSTKIKNYTAFMTETLASQRNDEAPENDTSDDDQENSERTEIKEKKAAKMSAEFFDSNSEISSDEESLCNSPTVSEPTRRIKKKSEECNRSNDEDTNAKLSKHLLKKYIKLKKDAVDFKLRYCGHCNVATDIKEANFLGENFICAGSDDGSFFIWDKLSTNVIRVLKGDDSIVNCLQPHPYAPYLATSGIDPYVRVWAPKIMENKDERVVADIKSAVINNQNQMHSHPFEFLFLNLNQNRHGFNEEEDSNNSQQSVACRPS